MKNRLGLAVVATVLFIVALACNMSTANMSSFKTSKDKEGTQETTAYKAGDTIYANAVISNNPGKVTVVFYMTVEEAAGMKKGDKVPNSEVKVELPSDGTAKYNFPTFPTTQGGKFIVTAEMLNESGEKKDSKSATITVAPGTPAAAADDDEKKP